MHRFGSDLHAMCSDLLEDGVADQHVPKVVKVTTVDVQNPVGSAEYIQRIDE